VAVLTKDESEAAGAPVTFAPRLSKSDHRQFIGRWQPSNVGLQGSAGLMDCLGGTRTCYHGFDPKSFSDAKLGVLIQNQ